MPYVAFLTLRYDSLGDALATAPEVIGAHRARSKELHARNALLLAVAFLDHPEEPLSTMAIFPTREAAEEFVAGDPFVLNGMVSNWDIREGADILAERTGDVGSTAVRASEP